MAERRMFAKTIIDSDAFIDMPVTARLLYYDLGMRADDDGVVNAPKKIMRMIGASQDDLAILAMRKFIIPFEHDGIIVIKHWRIHNYIRKDTYNATKYRDQIAQLRLDENNAYTLTVDEPSTSRLLTVDEPSTQVRLGKDRLGKDKDNKGTQRFKKPTIEEVRAYCSERGNNVNPDTFVSYYESKGWLVGRSPMKDWRAAVRQWEARDKERQAGKKNAFNRIITSDYDMDENLYIDN